MFNSPNAVARIGATAGSGKYAFYVEDPSVASVISFSNYMDVSYKYLNVLTLIGPPRKNGINKSVFF